MTTPFDEEDVDVPLRLEPVVARPQGWRGRSSSLVAIGLVAFVMVAVVVGTAFDDGRPAVSAPVAVASLTASPTTPRPSARPRATRMPLATPLPSRQVLGRHIPTERRLVFANGLEVLDLATGELSQLAGPIDYPSLALPHDEIVCACIVREEGLSGDGASPILRFRRFDQTGAPIVQRDLLSFEGVVDVPEATEGFSVGIGLASDSRSFYVLVVERRPPVWTVTLYVVDVETGEILTSVDVDRIPVGLDEPGPSASPRPGSATPDGVYLWSGQVTVAPGGRTVLLQVDRNEVRQDNWGNQMLEWMVDLPPGKPTTLTRLSGEAALEPGAWCPSRPTFIDAELLVQVCAGFTGGAPSGLHVPPIAPYGESLGVVRDRVTNLARSARGRAPRPPGRTGAARTRAPRRRAAWHPPRASPARS